MSWIAGVIVNLSVAKVDKIFDYIVPDELQETIDIGSRVVVPFNNNLVDGFVIEKKYIADTAVELKNIIESIDDIKYFSANMVILAKFIKERYNCLFIDALKCFIPPEVNISLKKKIIISGTADNTNLNDKERAVLEKIITSKKTMYTDEMDGDKKIIDRLRKMGIISYFPEINRGTRHKRVRMIKLKEGMFDDDLKEKEKDFIDYLKEKDWVLASKAVKDTGIDYSFIRRLYKKGVIDYEYRELRRIVKFPRINEKKYELNSSQLKVVSDYYMARKNGKSKFLLFGVSNSGKTDVYMNIAEQMLQDGKSVLILVPEVSLTPQVVARFVNRFGDMVSVFHSRLSNGQHFDEWDRVRRGEARIAVGTRSAVFLPMKDLGLIVIDEEHDTGFKQSDMHPYYDAKEVAIRRCELENASIILSSSTPSVETYYKAQLGEYELLNLSTRVNDTGMPVFEIVDLRGELKKGNRGILSRKLISELGTCLKNGDQAILFLNKRGYASFVMCKNCGNILKCPHCDIPLKYHSDKKILTCHYCNYNETVMRTCPKCGGTEMEFGGFGTQKIEREINKFFPDARVLRMDRDSIRGLTSINDIFSNFRDGKADILIGTQLVTKGFDFPGVTLAGVILADINLNLPDYKSSENTFQLLVQLGGRVGRRGKKGKVIIQTFNPQNYSIQYAARNDYIGFYQKEIEFRKQFGYPPFMRLGRALCSGPESEQVRKAIEIWYNDIKRLTKNVGAVDIKLLRPVPSPVARINDLYRWQFVLKGTDDREIAVLLSDSLRNIKKLDGVKYMMDVNPVSLM